MDPFVDIQKCTLLRGTSCQLWWGSYPPPPRASHTILHSYRENLPTYKQNEQKKININVSSKIQKFQSAVAASFSRVNNSNHCGNMLLISPNGIAKDASFLVLRTDM